MPANIGTEAIGVEQCVSCDAPLSGPYCARCGERVLEPEALTLRHFLVDTVAHDLPRGNGAPLRLRVERHCGYKNLKFVKSIQVVDSVARFGRVPAASTRDVGFH